MVAAAGILWGMIGPQVKILLNYQLSVQTIVLWRMIFAVLILFPFIFFTNRKALKLDLKGLIYISLIGIFSQFLFNVLYFSAIQKTTVATAVTLLFTSPVFVAIMARIFIRNYLLPLKL